MTTRCECDGQIDCSIKLQQTGAAWLFLALAIASEVVGLTVLKATAIDGRTEGYVGFYLIVAISYFFLSKALKRISVGVAYAIWEGSGIAIITIVSALVFQHSLTAVEAIGLVMATTGILMVNAGEVHDSAEDSDLVNLKGSHDVIS